MQKGKHKKPLAMLRKKRTNQDSKKIALDRK